MSMDLQRARRIMMGVEDATDDEIAQANEMVRAVQTVRATRAAAKEPPFQPPYQEPAHYPNSNSGDNNLAAGMFASNPYVTRLNYDSYVYDLNEQNRGEWSNYADLYRSWRVNFTGPGIAVDPPIPPARRVPMSLADFAGWWDVHSGDSTVTTTMPETPFKWERAPKISDFDFAAAVKAKAELMATQTAKQPSLGSLLKQQP